MGPGWPGRPATFKMTSEETGGKISIWESEVPAGAATPLHLHRTSDEVIYVIAGEFTVRLGEDQQRHKGGAWVFVPMGAVHAWRNEGPGNGRIAFMFAPSD